MSVEIIVDKVIKKFDENVVIPELSVTIRNGELFTLLGPSGCGKTTLLRMIAGFNSIEGGKINFDDKCINDLPAHKRNIGMVFQNYAIFPHMTVRENVEYGLKLRKIAKEELKNKVDDILETVKISEYQDRLPERLSGGQQQRVALARAIVIHPNVLLMDEPLSNLDAKLRLEMRTAIRDIQNKIGITTVYVTHDQEEALAISDRIAVMNKGVIQQVGKPHNIYSRPYNQFVSIFIGSSNLIYGKIVIENEVKYIEFKSGYRLMMKNLSDDVQNNQKVVVSIRPEEFFIANEGLEIKVEKSTFFGKYINYEIQMLDEEKVIGDSIIEFSQNTGDAEKVYQNGEVIKLKPNENKINVFTEDGEKSLIKGVVYYEEK